MSRRFPIALFCFFAALYMLTFRGVSVGDDVYHYEFVKSIIQRHDLSLPQNDPLLQTDREFSPFFAIGRDDRPYLTLPPGLSIASLPLGALGFLVESIAGSDSLEVESFDTGKRIDTSATIGEIRSTPSAFMAGLINPLAMALLMVVFYLFAGQVSGSGKRALRITMLLGCCTIIWPYSSTYWTQPIATLCLFSSLYFLYMYKDGNHPKYLVYSGLFLGYALLTRYETAVFIPFMLVYLVVGGPRERREVLRAAGLFLAAIGLFVLLLMLWNSYRFNSVLDSGAAHQHDLGFSLRGDLARSVPANLFGLNRSIFVYSPPLLLGVLAFPAFYRSRRSLALVTLMIIVVGFLMYSRFSLWVTFCNWGPRLMVILTPFLLLPVSLIRLDARWKRRLVFFLALAGAGIQFIAVSIPFQLHAVLEYYKPGDAGDHLLRSDIVPQFKALFSASPDLWWFADPAARIIGMLFIVVLLVAGWSLARTLLSKGDDGQVSSADDVKLQGSGAEFP